MAPGHEEDNEILITEEFYKQWEQVGYQCPSRLLDSDGSHIFYSTNTLPAAWLNNDLKWEVWAAKSSWPPEDKAVLITEERMSNENRMSFQDHSRLNSTE